MLPHSTGETTAGMAKPLQSAESLGKILLCFLGSFFMSWGATKLQILAFSALDEAHFPDEQAEGVRKDKPFSGGVCL